MTAEYGISRATQKKRSTITKLKVDLHQKIFIGHHLIIKSKKITDTKNKLKIKIYLFSLDVSNPELNNCSCINFQDRGC